MLWDSVNTYMDGMVVQGNEHPKGATLSPVGDRGQQINPSFL